MSTHVPSRPLIISRRLPHSWPLYFGRVRVTTTYASANTLAEFVDFLQLVYRVRVHLYQKSNDTAWFSLCPKHKSAAGFRVACWLHGLEFEIEHWPY